MQLNLAMFLSDPRLYHLLLYCNTVNYSVSTFVWKWFNIRNKHDLKLPPEVLNKKKSVLSFLLACLFRMTELQCCCSTRVVCNQLLLIGKVTPPPWHSPADLCHCSTSPVNTDPELWDSVSQVTRLPASVTSSSSGSGDLWFIATIMDLKILVNTMIIYRMSE